MSTCSIKRIPLGENIIKSLLEGDLNNMAYTYLPRSQKLTVIKTALEKIDTVNSNYKDAIKTSLEEELKRLEQRVQNVYYSKVNQDRDVLVDFNNPAIFTPWLNPELNKILYNNIRSIFTKLTIGDYDGAYPTICFGDASLNESIKSLKINLLNELQSFIGDPSKFYSNFNDEMFYSLYTDSMQKVLNKLSDFQKNTSFKDSNGIINTPLTSDFKKDFFNAFQNYLILTYFDDFCEAFGVISLDASEKGRIISTEETKYSLDSSTFFNPSFSDDVRQNDGEKTAPNFLKNFITSIKLDNGNYVSWQSLSLIANALHNIANRDTESLAAKFFKDPSFRNLQDALSSELVKNESVYKSAEGILKALTAYNKVFEEKVATQKDGDILSEIVSQRNVVAQVIHYITSTSAQIYVETTDTETVQKTTSKVATSKQAYLSLITSRVRENYLNHAHNLYQVGYVMNSGESFNQLFSTKVLNNLYQILGISLENIQETFMDEKNMVKLGSFISTLQTLYNRYFFHKYIHAEQLDTVIENFKNQLINQGEYIEFINVLIEAVDRNNFKIIDQNGNTIPGSGIFSHANNFQAAKDAFIEGFGVNAETSNSKESKNILVKNPNLTKPNPQDLSDNFAGHSCYRSDVMLANGVAVSPVLLSANETITLWLTKDFLESGINKGIIYLQAEGYSDKPRLAINAYRINEILKQNTTTQELVDLFYDQTNDYYTKVEAKMVSKWSKIIPLLANPKNVSTQIASITDVINFLEQNQTKFEAVHAAGIEIQKSNPKFEFVKDSDFVIDQNDTVGINRAFVLKLAIAKNRTLFNHYYNEQLDHFLEEIKTAKLPIGEKLTKGADVTWEQIEAITGVKFDEKSWENFIKDGWSADNQITKTVLTRYFAIQALLKDAELQIGIKHPWCHTTKVANNITLSDAQAILNGETDSPAYQKAIEEQQDRLIKGKKRNAAGVVTFTPMYASQYGVSEEMRIAVCQFPKYNVANHFGTKEALNPHDGATFINPIWSIFEENSYPGKKYLGSRKTIGLYISDYSITQIKHAEYTMNNAWIRGTFADTVTDDAFNGQHLMKTMLSPAKITDNFIQGWKSAKDNGDNLSFNPIYYNFNGIDAYLDEINIDDDGYIEFIWRNGDTDERISDDFVLNLFDTNVTVKQNTEGHQVFKLDNIYQLWCALGGAECKSYVNDELVYADVNNKMIALLIGTYDTTIKSKMIAKICDAEAVKSGSLGFNTAQDLKEGKLFTGLVKVAYFGIQQDYTHLAEDSDIPALTQVITAIAFNGNNVQLVNKAYRALGAIVENSLKKFTDYKSTKDLERMLGERLYKSLKKNSIASNAITLVNDFLKEISEGHDTILPVSNAELFYKIASDIVSNLNNETIKQKFKGIAVIQNPAQGIVGLYEDAAGNIYTRTDLIKKAEKLDFSQENHLLTTSEKLDRYFKQNPDLWQDELLTSANFYKIAVGDKIRIGNAYYEVVPFDTNGNKISFDKIKEQLNLNNVYKVHTKQRNLKCHNITFQHENGSWDNLFCLASAKALATSGLSQENRLLYKKWHIANLKLLQKQIGYYATLADFKSQRITHVTQVKDELGEQVIPKVHSEFNLGSHSLSEVLEQGAEFFETDIKELLTLKTKLEKHEIGLATHGGEIVISNREITDEDRKKQNVYIKSEGLKKTIVDSNDNFLCYIDSNTDEKQFCGYLESIDGKRVLRIITGDTTAITNSNSYIAKCVAAIDNGGEKVIQAVYSNGSNENILITSKNQKLFAVYGKYNHSVRGDNLDQSVKSLAEAKYNSFLLTLKTISARIPSQSFQSFLATKTVAFTEDNFNNGYMNIWEMWFQGSDFDIDKAYTLLFDVSKNGLIQGNIFTDYTNSDNIEKSLQLSAGEYNLQLTKDTDSEFDQILQKCGIDGNSRTWEVLNARTDKYDLIEKIIQELNTRGTVTYNANDDTALISMFINYTHNNSRGFKNKIAEVILAQSSNLENLESSEQPMSAENIKHAIDTAYKKKEKTKTTAVKPTYYEWDPFTIARIQYDNSMGKQDVGIAANGVKAAGALQQYYNERYETIEGTLRKAFRLDLDFSVDGDSTHSGKYSFCRLANTVLSKESFNALFDKEYGENQHPDQELFNQLKSGQEVKDLTEHQSKIKAAFNIYKSEFGKAPEDLKTLLYYAINFEDNVADNLSVFISLATDNAKELQLARIYGTPDLLSIPLAMLTLGIDVQSVMDICVKYLGRVAEELETNRFVGKRKDVRDVIKESKTLPGNVQESLLKIYDFAQELRTVTSFFKVNQGVETRYAKLKAWFDDLTLSRARIAKAKGIKGEDFKQPFDILRFFDEADYRQKIIDQYEELKEVINIAELINDSPHFRAQLRATAKLIKQFESISGKAFLSNQIITNSNVDIKKRTDSEILNSQSFRLIDDWVIGQYLRSNEKFQFAVSSAQDNWNILHRYGPTAVINLSSSTGIRAFVDLVNALIPKLQEVYKDNMFLKSLISKVDKSTGQMYFDFNVDPYATKNDDSLKELYATAITQFDYIRKQSSGIRSIDGTLFNIGELLYVYGIITSKGKTTGMKTITNIAKNSSTLKQGIEKVYDDLDQLLKLSQSSNSEGEKAKETLKNISEFLTPYLEALYNKSTVTIQDPEEEDINYVLDIQGEWLATLSKSANFNSELNSNQLAKYLKSQHVLCDININKTSNNELAIEVTHTGLNGITNILKLSVDVQDSNSLQSDEISLISNKVQEFIDNCAPYLEQELQEALSQSKSLSDVLTEISISYTPKYDFLKKLFNENYTFLPNLQSRVNYITKIDDKFLFVIDPSLFSSYDDTNDPEMSMLDLFLQKKALDNQKGISEAARVNVLLTSHKEDFGIRTDNEFKKLQKNYIEYLEANSEIDEVKIKALDTVYKYENVILSGHKELYYINVDNNSKLEVGDLVLDKDSNREYMYVTDTRQGKPVFVAIDGARIVTTAITPISIKKLITAPNTIIKFLQSNIEYNDSTESKSLKSIYPGCQFINPRNGNLIGTVTDVLIKKINDKIYHRVIAETSGHETLVFDRIDDGTWTGTNITTGAIPYSNIAGDTNMTVKVPKTFIMNESTQPEITNTNKVFKYLLNNLQSGFIVKQVDNQGRVIFNGRVLTVNGDKVVTNNGEVEKDKITSIQYNNNSDFFNHVKPILIGFRQNTDPTNRNNPDNFANDKTRIWHPEFSNGYSVINKVDLSSKVWGLGNTSKYDMFVIAGLTETKSPKVDCLGLKQQIPVTKNSIQVGDYIEEHVNNTTTIYKVLNKDPKGNLIVEYVSYLLTPLSDSRPKNYKDLTFYKDSELNSQKGITIKTEQELINQQAVKLQEKTNGEFTTYNTLKNSLIKVERSDLEICNDVIDAIQKATNLPVIVNTTDEAVDSKGKKIFAKATDQGITIYVKNKKPKESISNYILNQCAHEFTHMLLYSVKAQSPETYLEIVRWARQDLKKDPEKFSAEDIREAEEHVVHLIQESYNSIDDKSFDNIKEVIQQQFARIFNLRISEMNTLANDSNQKRHETGINMQYSLKDMLESYQSNFIAETTTNYSMDSFKNQMLSNKILSEIEMIC